MISANKYIAQHIGNLELLNKTLDGIDGSNSDNDFKKLQRLVNQVVKERNYINKSFSNEEILTFELEITKNTKQIREKFDNIVEINKETQAGLKRELGQLFNQKKLANYHR